jgi:hypothetical protein
MIVGIVGSRKFSDWRRVQRFVDDLRAKYPDAVVLSGGAEGVDTRSVTRQMGTFGAYAIYMPFGDCRNWAINVVAYKYSRGWHVTDAPNGRITTGFIYSSFRNPALARNRWIAEDADQLVAFWDGKSPGTGYTIRYREKLGKPLHVYLSR